MEALGWEAIKADAVNVFQMLASVRMLLPTRTDAPELTLYVANRCALLTPTRHGRSSNYQTRRMSTCNRPLDVDLDLDPR